MAPDGLPHAVPSWGDNYGTRDGRNVELGWPPLNVQIEIGDDNRVVVYAAGEIDIATVNQLRIALDRALDSGPRDLVVDLVAVSLLSAAGLNCLITTQQRAHATNVPFSLVAKNSIVTRLLEHTGLADTLRLTQD